MTSGRYHVLLAVAGQPMMHGWWDDEATARRQFVSWIGERGGIPGVRITLTETVSGEELDCFPGGSPTAGAGAPNPPGAAPSA